MIKIFTTATLATAIAFAAQNATKPKDLCVPPPSAVAPSLPAQILEGQGSVHFAITTSNPKAQEFFDQGLAQLHSFWAREAERSFLQAAALDPDAPMPHWGIAMVAAGDYRPRFQIDQLAEAMGKLTAGPESRAVKAAKTAVELSAVPGKASELEKLYIASVAGHRLPGPKNPDDAYIEGLRAVMAKYPKEVEARTFLALHLMRGFVRPGKTPREGSTEAADLLRQLMIDAPEHAGVHHYVIHGFEGSTFNKDAWPSSKKYAELVTNIPHALHMPGHIYSQTGRLADARKSFEDAAANERKYMEADQTYGNGHHGHNINYLTQVNSMDGQYEKAIEGARELLAMKENPREAAGADNFSTAYRQGWFSLMRTLVQAERWDAILDGTTLPVIDKPRQRAWRAWAIGVAQANKGDRAAAMKSKAEMLTAIESLKAATKLGAPEELLVGVEELNGHIALAGGKTGKGLKTLAQAAKKERALRYTEPPWYPRPVAEAQGSAAMRKGKVKEAEQAFRAVLEQVPGSYRANEGLRQMANANVATAP